MSIQQRHFRNENEQRKLADDIEDAASIGVDHIELCHIVNELYTVTTIGVEQLKIEHRKAGPGLSQLQLVKRWIKDGELVFYPDRRGRRWGYLADTEYNRKFLALSLCEREKWFVIVDKDIRNEIFKLAEKLGIDTTPHRADPLQHMLEKKNPELAKHNELERELEELKKQLEEEKKKNIKPLSGVSINKSNLKKKVTQINTSNVGFGDR